MFGNLQLGRKGEEIAQKFLRGRGYRIIEKNFRCPFGEIDLVAREGKELVFIEVKTRTSGRFGLPQEAVNRHKQRRLSRLAQYYLVSQGMTGADCRFDVVAVLWPSPGAQPEVELIKNAFPFQGG